MSSDSESPHQVLETAAEAMFASGESLARLVARFEKHLIEEALRATGGNRAKAARLLRTTERIVGYRVRQYGIDWRVYREQVLDDASKTATA